VQQHLPQQEIQTTGLSVQAPISINNDTLKIATLVQQIMTKLNETVSEKRHNNGHYKNST
jgi:acyl-ACP thioesterase